MSIAVELLGVSAWTIVCSSALPRIIGILRDRQLAAAESLARNAMLCGGNLLWVVYGSVAGAVAIVLMCALAAALNGAVLAFALSARGRQLQANTRKSSYDAKWRLLP